MQDGVLRDLRGAVNFLQKWADLYFAINYALQFYLLILSRNHMYHGEKCQSFRGKLAYVTIERVSTKKIQKKNGAGQHTAFFT